MALHGDKHVISGVGIILWDGVTNPDENDAGQKVWNLKVAWPATAPEVAELQALATAEFQAGIFKGAWPAGGIWPISESKPNEFEGAINGHVVSNLKTYNGAPEVYYNKQRLTPEQYQGLLYPGAKVKVMVHAFSYNKKSKGVSLGLDGIEVIDASTPRLPGTGGVNVAAAFGGTPTPATSAFAPGGAPGAPGAPVPPAAAPGGGFTPVGAPAAPGTPVAPNPGFLNPPPVPGAAPPPPAPAAPVKTMTAAAGGNTYEAYVGAGWTDQQLVDQGLMVIQ